MLAAVALGLLLAQAEPAPVPPPAPTVVAEPEDNRTISAFLGGSFRVSNSGAELWPSSGFSIGGAFEYRYMRLGAPDGHGPLLGASLGFIHDHFANNLTDATTSNLLTKTGFVAAQTLAVPFSAVTPWVGAGGGIIFGYYSADGSGSTSQLVAVGEAGLDVAISADGGLRLRFNFTHALTGRQYVTGSGRHADLYGDLFDGDIGVFYRF